MSIIKNSTACPHPDLDLFYTPPTNTSVEYGNWIEINPTTTTNNGILEFHHPGSDNYIQLSETDFYVKVKIYKLSGSDKKNLEDTDIVAPINNFMHSLFSQVDVTIGNLTIENSNKLYPYKAYMSDLLNNNSEVKKTQMASQFWYDDDAYEMDNLAIESVKYTHLESDMKGKILSDYMTTIPVNSGFIKRRRALLDGNGVIEMIGKLNCDLFNTNRYLISNVPFTVKLTQNDSKFCLMHKATDNFQVEILSAILIPRIARISPSVKMAHLAALEKYPIKYPIKRVVVKSNLIPSGVTASTINFTTLSSTPSRIIFGLVRQAGSTGHSEMNPFNFENFGLSSISLDVGGQARPFAKELDIDYKNNKFIRNYYSLSEQIKKPYPGHGISLEEYKGGKAFYIWDLTPDLLGGECFNLIHKDNVAINVKFSDAPTVPLSAITLLEFDNIIETDKDLQFSADYRI